MNCKKYTNQRWGQTGIILLVIISISFSDKVKWIPLEKQIYYSDLVILGEIVEMIKADLSHEYNETIYDTAIIRVDTVIFDQMEEPVSSTIPKKQINES